MDMDAAGAGRGVHVDVARGLGVNVKLPRAPEHHASSAADVTTLTPRWERCAVEPAGRRRVPVESRALRGNSKPLRLAAAAFIFHRSTCFKICAPANSRFTLFPFP